MLDILDLLDVDQDKDLAERCFSIIHTVGSHSISVPQCKHLFKFLRRHSQEKNVGAGKSLSLSLSLSFSLAPGCAGE